MYNTLDSMEFLWPTIERIYQKKSKRVRKRGHGGPIPFT